jgi:hypothetical protein
MNLPITPQNNSLKNQHQTEKENHSRKILKINKNKNKNTR